MTKARSKDLPDIDRGDFRCRRAVHSSSCSMEINDLLGYICWSSVDWANPLKLVTSQSLVMLQSPVVAYAFCLFSSIFIHFVVRIKSVWAIKANHLLLILLVHGTFLLDCFTVLVPVGLSAGHDTYYSSFSWCCHLSDLLILIDPSHKSHVVPDKYPTTHHFVTEMCARVHISVTKWCNVGYLSGELWDLWDGSVKVEYY